MQALSNRSSARPVGTLKIVLLVAAFASIQSLGALLLAGERSPL